MYNVQCRRGKYRLHRRAELVYSAFRFETIIQSIIYIYIVIPLYLPQCRQSKEYICIEGMEKKIFVLSVRSPPLPFHNRHHSYHSPDVSPHIRISHDISLFYLHIHSSIMATNNNAVTPYWHILLQRIVSKKIYNKKYCCRHYYVLLICYTISRHWKPITSEDMHTCRKTNRLKGEMSYRSTAARFFTA